jgi:hypothetical protein
VALNPTGDRIQTEGARLDELIRLDGPKQQIAVWRTEIQIDQLPAAEGEETSSTNEDHVISEGPAGAAKTSLARIVAEILFGLGKIQRPDVVEGHRRRPRRRLRLRVPRRRWVSRTNNR